MNIKKLFSSFAAAILVFAACEETNPDLGDPSVTLSKTQLEFAKEGGSQEITLNSTRDWSVLNRPEWVSITPEKGAASAKDQTIVISVMPNDDSPRTCVLTFIGTTARADLAISQDGDGVAPGGEISCAEFLEKKDTENEYTLRGKMGNISRGSSYYGFYVNDGTAEVCCPFPDNWDEFKDQAHTGSEVVVKGKYSYFDSKKQDQLSDGTIISINAPEGNVEALTVSQFLEKKDSYTLYKLTGSVTGTIKADYCSFTLKDDTGSVVVYSVNNASEYGSKLAEGGIISLTGAYQLYNDTPEVVDATVLSYEGPSTPKRTAEGLVVAVSSKSFVIKTSDSYDYAYGTHEVKLGDMVKVTGDASEYNGVAQVANFTVETLSSGNEVKHPEPTVLDKSSIDGYSTVFGYVQIEGALSISGNYYNINLGSSTRTGSLVSPIGVDASASGKNVKVKGYYVGLSGGSKYFNVVMTDIEVGEDVGGGEVGTDADITPAADETLLTLTNEEILASSIGEGSSYETISISSESGTWTANVNTQKNTTFLQFRNKAQSFVSSPEFSSDIKRVVLKYNSDKMGSSSRTIYAVPFIADPTSLPTASSDNTLWTTNYGSWNFSSGKPLQVEAKFPEGVRNFTLISANGAVYIDEIYVFIKK